ncbi:hypothetical protein DFS34DRAFT_605882 [Phlyctochytrium arcticum]|nr:hypothetical protein DFS34DRAFT_605882 [Phlyctochytrium arcticum]
MPLEHQLSNEQIVEYIKVLESGIARPKDKDLENQIRTLWSNLIRHLNSSWCNYESNKGNWKKTYAYHAFEIFRKYVDKNETFGRKLMAQLGWVERNTIFEHLCHTTKDVHIYVEFDTEEYSNQEATQVANLTQELNNVREKEEEMRINLSKITTQRDDLLEQVVNLELQIRKTQELESTPASASEPTPSPSLAAEPEPELESTPASASEPAPSPSLASKRATHEIETERSEDTAACEATALHRRSTALMRSATPELDFESETRPLTRQQKGKNKRVIDENPDESEELSEVLECTSLKRNRIYEKNDFKTILMMEWKARDNSMENKEFLKNLKAIKDNEEAIKFVETIYEQVKDSTETSSWDRDAAVGRVLGYLTYDMRKHDALKMPLLIEISSCLLQQLVTRDAWQ